MGPGGRRRHLAGFLAGLLTLALLLLAVEGALSLAGASRTLATGFAAPPDAPVRRGATDADRRLADGPWRVHEDPRVGFTFRPDGRHELAGVTVATDALGLRRRTGAPAADDALRIVVLGDSVAFGLGVPDEACVAQRLEDRLAETALPGARPVVCRTVALPGWNTRNAVAFLLDHWDELRPDVVLYWPISNDLADTYGVWETGHRREAPDVAAPDPWLAVSTDALHVGGLALARRLQREGRAAPPADAIGPLVLQADLSPESSRRYDENAAWIARLAAQLQRSGGQLALVSYANDDYEALLLQRLDRLGLDLPLVGLLSHVPREFTLGHDPHPNAGTHDVFALWCAEALLAQGWVDGRDAARLPEAPAAYRALRAEPAGAAQRAARADAARARDVARLLPSITLDDGRGYQQVYGGLNPDGTARRHLLLLLARGGPLLELELAPLAARPDLHPLRIAVDVDGAPCDVLVLTADAPLHARLPLPPGDGPLEVRLRAEAAVTMPWEGFTQLSAYRFVAARCTAP